MNFDTRVICIAILSLFLASSRVTAEPLREEILRRAAIESGLRPVNEVNQAYDEERSKVGRQLFESTSLSLNGGSSCRACHLPQFSSADGLPNAIGVNGDGEGPVRLFSEGEIVPRNTLPLWGRGGKDFRAFFWDGKVELDPDSGLVISQFGNSPPSDDPLIVAAHLPFVELDEMVDQTKDVQSAYEKESLSAANEIYDELLMRIQEDPKLSEALAITYGMHPKEMQFGHIVDAIAHFIRDEFRLRPTKFHHFVFEGKKLSNAELRGGLVFYGKGQCASCHNGPYFTDFKYHAIAFPQLGFGKNGFGVDYGRYNTTFIADDIYKFRTPPLYNVEHTAPYSHSGSVPDLEQAVIGHFDPLALVIGDLNDPRLRQEFYRQLQVVDIINLDMLTADDIRDLVAFLKALSYCDPSKATFCQR